MVPVVNFSVCSGNRKKQEIHSTIQSACPSPSSTKNLHKGFFEAVVPIKGDSVSEGTSWYSGWQHELDLRCFYYSCLICWKMSWRLRCWRTLMIPMAVCICLFICAFDWTVKLPNRNHPTTAWWNWSCTSQVTSKVLSLLRSKWLLHGLSTPDCYRCGYPGAWTGSTCTLIWPWLTTGKWSPWSRWCLPHHWEKLWMADVKSKHQNQFAWILDW